MNKRTGYKGDTTKWGSDPNKTVTYEFEFKGHVVKNGSKLKLKNDRTVYTFLCLVHDSRLDKTWLELLGPCGFHFKTIDKVMSIVGIKRSYKKKMVV